MSWYLFAWRWMTQAAAAGFVVLLVGSLAALVCRQPVQRVRLIILAYFGSMIVPWLGALSIAPTWSPALFAPQTRKPAPASALGVLAGPARSKQANNTDPLSFHAPVPSNTLETINRTRVALPSRLSIRSEAGASPRERLLRSLHVVPWRLTALATYILASLGFVVWWLIGQYRLLRITRSAWPATSLVCEHFLDISGSSGAKVALLVSDRITLPFTFTWRRPVILLPEDLCDGQDVEALRYALAHEWSHVERRDAWAWNLANITGFALFYQPLFWWLRRQLRLCQDYLADDQAAARGSAEDYAAYLVRLARERGALSTLPALGIGDRRSNLSRRVVMLVQNQEPLDRRCRPLWNLATALATAATMLVAAGLRLNAAPADEPKPQSDKKVENPAPPKAEGETLHYTGKVKDKVTGKPIEGVKVTVRRSVPRDKGNQVTLQETQHTTDVNGNYSFIIPPEQVAEKRLYIELDVEHPDYATQSRFGYALGMILKNEKLGERPFFENVTMRPAQPVTGRIETPEGQSLEGVELLAYSRSSKPQVGEDFEYGSFARTKTDKDGHFRLPITTPGIGVFWILPKAYAPEMHPIKLDKRGDYGTFALKNGITVSGQALDHQGKPLAGLFVKIERAERGTPDTEILSQLIVADALERQTETDSQGRFSFEPLPPGTFTVQPIDYKLADGGSVLRRPLPAVFTPQKLTLKEGETPEPIEIRAAPHVVIEGRWIDSSGNPKGGWDLMIAGQIDGQFWHTQGHPSADGIFSAKVPHGLENVNIDIMTNEHASMRRRIGKNGTLSTNRYIRFKTLDHDVKDLEIIRYVAPIVTAKITSKDGQPLSEPSLTGEYLEEKEENGLRIVLSNGRNSDISFNKQEDGRFRTSQVTPDREFLITAYAKGYKPESQRFKLSEGKTEEVTFVLEPENKPAKESAEAPPK